jgi:hypothetical protein
MLRVQPSVHPICLHGVIGTALLGDDVTGYSVSYLGDTAAVHSSVHCEGHSPGTCKQ